MSSHPLNKNGTVFSNTSEGSGRISSDLEGGAGTGDVEFGVDEHELDVSQQLDEVAKHRILRGQESQGTRHNSPQQTKQLNKHRPHQPAVSHGNTEHGPINGTPHKRAASTASEVSFL